MEKIRNFVCLKVYGKYALFPTPLPVREVKN